MDKKIKKNYAQKKISLTGPRTIVCLNETVLLSTQNIYKNYGQENIYNLMLKIRGLLDKKFYKFMLEKVSLSGPRTLVESA